jgi:hypothetical protein
VLFDYQNNRHGECVVNYLDGYTRYLQVDGYQAYRKTQATLPGHMPVVSSPMQNQLSQKRKRIKQMTYSL